METILVEVCVDSLQSAKYAARGGAKRIELCSSLSEGGLTPSAGLLTMAKNYVKNVPIYAMLRCRAGSDFCYSSDEMHVMLADIDLFKQLNVDGFVFGALTTDGSIDIHACNAVISAADPLPVTFHRAFDSTNDPIKALETVIDLGFERILTSGQQESAGHELACKTIKKLVEVAQGRIVIMPGAGITLHNIDDVLRTGIKEIHASFKAKKQLPSSKHRVETGRSDCDFIYVTDEKQVRHMVRYLHNYGTDLD